MPLPTKGGRYRAIVSDVGINESGNPPKCCVAMTFTITNERTPENVWRDNSSENLSITGYFYIEKNDGSLNEFTIKNLKDTLKWDGRDLNHLLTAKGAEVQITCDYEEYQGQRKMKMQFLNPADWEGGGVTHDATALTRAQNRLGSKLRANAGGTSVPAVTPPPPTDDCPFDVPGENENRESTANEAWAKLQERFPSLPSEKQGATWTKVLNDVLPGISDISAVTPRQWGQVIEAIESPDFRAVA